MRVLFYPGQNEVARPVNRSITARTAVRERNNPLDLWRVLFDKANGLSDAIRFAVPRKVVIKGHTIQLEKFVPAGIANEADNFRLVE